MTDTKARRVMVEEMQRWFEGSLIYYDEIKDDPSGTHMLVPVEVWEGVKFVISRAIDARSIDSEAKAMARRALAEIGGEDV